MASDQWYGDRTYSQHGEDLLIANIFKLIGAHKPTFIDLGAHHPTHISNTWLLYQNGSRGVNVDANQKLIDLFNQKRPEDVNVCVGVSATKGLGRFLMHDDLSGRNSFCQAEFDADPNLKVSKTVDVELTTVNDLIVKHFGGFWPNFLSIDIEGLDYQVLETANFMWGNLPHVVCVEARKKDSWRFNSLMKHRGYFPVVRMGENLIFAADPHRQALS
jgi:FkbM family methyltransferase